MNDLMKMNRLHWKQTSFSDNQPFSTGWPYVYQMSQCNEREEAGFQCSQGGRTVSGGFHLGIVQTLLTHQWGASPSGKNTFTDLWPFSCLHNKRTLAFTGLVFSKCNLTPIIMHLLKKITHLLLILKWIFCKLTAKNDIIAVNKKWQDTLSDFVAFFVALTSLINLLTQTPCFQSWNPCFECARGVGERVQWPLSPSSVYWKTKHVPQSAPIREIRESRCTLELEGGEHTTYRKKNKTCAFLSSIFSIWSEESFSF